MTGWRITEWRNDALGRRLFLGQLCWLTVRAGDRCGPLRVIGEIVELEPDPSGERLLRVKLWCRALKTTLPRAPRQITPIDPRHHSIRLVHDIDQDQEDVSA